MGAMINEDRFGVVSINLNVAQVAQGVSAEQTFTLQGARTKDFVAVSKPTLHAGLIVASARVSAKDTLAIQFMNATGSPITPGIEAYQVFWFRPERTQSAISA